MHSAKSPPLIVGGGIVGLATAVAMAERGHAPIVLEAEGHVGAHQTGHNSGVIHSGLYYKPGSLKAQMCRDGLREMYRFCSESGIPHRRCGKLVIAVSQEDLPRLATLEERARANGVEAIRVSRDGIKDREPEAAGIAGLWIPSTGVVSYAAVSEAMAERVKTLGGEVRLRHRVLSIHRRGAEIVLETTGGALKTSRLVNCAGLQSDRIAEMAGVRPQVRIIPFRGEYYTLRPDRADLVRGLIYPVPDPALPFLGVHFTRGIDDVVEAGPNAVLALKREGYSKRDISPKDIAGMITYPGFWRMASTQWRTGWDEVRRSLSKDRFVASLRRLVPAITDADVEAGGSGVRAQAVRPDGRLVDDFVIQSEAGMVHVLNAPSPAATASLVIGREIADRILGEKNKSIGGAIPSFRRAAVAV
ncbi:MAG TPA: L-2-hydroxyglutarate oxidase [Gemmatimonadaceae bacterium]|nr:L-2-hydroxyglutarate oxidase [Gemmatimonadaceae bacterium]